MHINKLDYYTYIFWGNRSKLHDDKIARGYFISRGDKVAREQNCTSAQICTKPSLHKAKLA